MKTKTLVLIYGAFVAGSLCGYGARMLEQKAQRRPTARVVIDFSKAMSVTKAGDSLYVNCKLVGFANADGKTMEPGRDVFDEAAARESAHSGPSKEAVPIPPEATTANRTIDGAAIVPCKEGK